MIGFIVSAYLVGKLAEHRHGRQFVTGVGAFTLGSLIIYVFGVLGLMMNLDMTVGQAVVNGVVPFVFWDILKALVAGGVLAGAWRISGESTAIHSCGSTPRNRGRIVRKNDLGGFGCFHSRLGSLDRRRPQLGRLKILPQIGADHVRVALHLGRYAFGDLASKVHHHHPVGNVHH